MLQKRISKRVFESRTNGAFNMNFPKDAVRRFGLDYIFDIYDDKIVLYPVENLGKIKEE